jgi:hypothetical protein
VTQPPTAKPANDLSPECPTNSKVSSSKSPTAVATDNAQDTMIKPMPVYIAIACHGFLWVSSVFTMMHTVDVYE